MLSLSSKMGGGLAAREVRDWHRRYCWGLNKGGLWPHKRLGDPPPWLMASSNPILTPFPLRAWRAVYRGMRVQMSRGLRESTRRPGSCRIPAVCCSSRAAMWIVPVQSMERQQPGRERASAATKAGRKGTCSLVHLELGCTQPKSSIQHTKRTELGTIG